jgi:tetratricopeptide (TPR) repeat protein
MARKNLAIAPLSMPARTENHASNSTKHVRGSVPKLLAILLIALTAQAAPAVDSARQSVIKIVTQIQRADYEGDRAALQRLYGQLTPFFENKELASRVRYWRGFALWRRVINGFNESVDAKEQEQDLNQALDEFGKAAASDPGFVDAKVGAESCLGFLIGLNPNDAPRVQELIARATPLRKEIEAAAPENPRFLWVQGSIQWYVPPERGGGQAKAMETYQKGLDAARKLKGSVTDPLDPSWGEPELLMSLAGANFYRTTPDLNAAEQYARSALELVPYWHYVKDILLPQIQEARRKPH